ncbi:MAG: aspartate ammonia-lyase [Nitrospinae bacterium]|nr:aspartate ammonia-lyase [Nitrospinota bacterium]
MKVRIEKDSLGEVEVPASACYGAHTARSLQNFPISGYTAPEEQVVALSHIKRACARANGELKGLAPRMVKAIEAACREIAGGALREQMKVDIFSAGSGTSINMNINEVIAHRAAELMGGKARVHPNDHVNMGQSTNNVFPSSIRVAALPMLRALIASAARLERALRVNARRFDRVIKSGRTHLQDAVPIRMGQVFGAYAYAIEKDIARLKGKTGPLSELGVGGNAVGTGINTHASFRARIIRNLNRETGERYRVTKNGVEATHNLTDLADTSSGIVSLALDVQRICTDLMLMASGPNTGFDEIRLPPVEPGSSIMPGKINPSILESARMACLKAHGNHQTIVMAAQSAHLELNTTMPVAGFCLLESLRIMRAALDNLAERCISGITVNREKCRRYAMQSPSLAAFLNPLIGYDRAAQVAKQAVREGKTVPEVVRERSLLTGKEIARVFDPKTLTTPYKGKPGAR